MLDEVVSFNCSSGIFSVGGATIFGDFLTTFLRLGSFNVELFWGGFCCL